MLFRGIYCIAQSSSHGNVQYSAHHSFDLLCDSNHSMSMCNVNHIFFYYFNIYMESCNFSDSDFTK